MLQFREGQEYLISERKLRWTYQHGISSEKYRRDVDRELTVRQLEIIRGNPDNGYYKFYYNGSLIENFSIDVSSDPNLVIIKIDDPFPGYAPGHIVYQSLPYDAKAKPIERFFVKLDNGKAFERREFGEYDCPICRSILSEQAPETISIPLEDGKELRYELVKPKVEPSGQEALSETTRLKNRFQVMAENMRVQAHLERILAAIPVPTKDVIFIGIKGRVFAYDLMNEDGFRRMEQGEYEHIYKVVADGDSNRVIKISTEPEAEK